MRDEPFLLHTERFFLRPLRVEDAGEHYLSWLADPTAVHIEASRTTRELAELARYVADKSGRPDVLFLGVFESASGRHIGNIKFEPIDREQGYAVLGMLIGDRDFRGRGVAGEIIAATTSRLRQEGLREIVLGVARDNHAAIRAYEKAGFEIGDTQHLPERADAHRMILRL